MLFRGSLQQGGLRNPPPIPSPPEAGCWLFWGQAPPSPRAMLTPSLAQGWMVTPVGLCAPHHLARDRLRLQTPFVPPARGPPAPLQPASLRARALLHRPGQLLPQFQKKGGDTLSPALPVPSQGHSTAPAPTTPCLPTVHPGEKQGVLLHPRPASPQPDLLWQPVAPGAAESLRTHPGATLSTTTPYLPFLDGEGIASMRWG